MEEILNFQNITALLFIIIYGSIFFIQKAQFRKQKEVLEKYEKIFNIINIDEIEKYVQLKQRSLELSYLNRESELQNIEKKYDQTYSEVKSILDSTKSNLEKTDEIKNTLKSMLDRNDRFVTNLMKLNMEEFDKIYRSLENHVDNKKIKDQIYKELKQISKEYDFLKREELKKI